MYPLRQTILKVLLLHGKSIFSFELIHTPSNEQIGWGLMNELFDMARAEERAGDNGNVVASVHTRLRSMILSGALMPGTVISQVELAERLGVSRTPLREALRLLQHENLIEAEQNRRPRVAAVGPASIDALYAERIMLEALGITLTVPLLQQADLDALHAALEAMARAMERRDVDGWEAEHRRLHQLTIMYAGTELRSRIAGYVERSERFRQLYGERIPRTWSVSPREHDLIVEACAERQPELAAQRLTRHLARTALTLLVNIAPEFEARTVRAALRIIGADNPRAEPVAEPRRKA